MEELVIVGGGIAGLSCLNALLDKGIAALLLEGAKIGTPKVCGEFISSEAMSALEKWEIFPTKIEQAIFLANSQQLTIKFPRVAGAIARDQAELLLAKRATNGGAKIRENSPVEKITPANNHSPHRIHMTSGEIIQVKNIIFASGKFAQHINTPRPLRYSAIKFHIQHIAKPKTLYMHSLPSAYLGIVPISETTSNCACLIKNLQSKYSKTLFDDLLASNPAVQDTFKNVDISKINVLEGSAPEFQKNTLPKWPHSYWIGDTQVTLPPAIGSGFAHSINTAIMVAEYYSNNDPTGYQRACNKLIKPRLYIGKFIHQLLLNPTMAAYAMPLTANVPAIHHWFLNKLGYNTKA